MLLWLQFLFAFPFDGPPSKEGKRQALENSLPPHLPRSCALHSSQAPGTAWGLSKPWKGILLASLSRGTEFSVSCITCHASRKRASPHYVLHLLGVEYHLASLGIDSESPFTLPSTAGGCHSSKANQNRYAGMPAHKKGTRLPQYQNSGLRRQARI